eukprot:gene4099-5128_t
MPPKGAQPNKKAVEKDNKKKIESLTFGMKNKNKSSKVQKYVKQVENQVANAAAQKKAAAKTEQNKKEKEALEKAKKDAAMSMAILQPVITQPKVPLGVDPKSIVCEYIKQKVECPKGNKCKFSHDLAAGRKTAKIDIYTDRRNQPTEEDKKNETMEDWDDAKLKTVVENKRTAANKQIKTNIICKYFLDAIESKKYGFFWECPNGGDKCAYQHCLPEGYELKKKKIEQEDEENKLTLEEIIETERAKLTKSTPVTLETFTKWKEEKKLQKEKEAKLAEEKRQADIKAGKTQMSGREIKNGIP